MPEYKTEVSNAIAACKAVLKTAEERQHEIVKNCLMRGIGDIGNYVAWCYKIGLTDAEVIVNLSELQQAAEVLNVG